MATTSRKKKSTSSGKKAANRSEMPLSIGLFAVGILLVVMLFVEGQALWLAVRTALFCFFGANMYLIGVVLLYLAVLAARGEKLLAPVLKAAAFMLCVSGAAIVFSKVDPGTVAAGTWIKDYAANGSDSVFGGGLAGVVLGGLLLGLCGRPAANIIVIVLLVCAAMVFAGVTPAEVWDFAALHLGGFAGSLKTHGGAAMDDYREKRAERREELEALRGQQEQARQEQEQQLAARAAQRGAAASEGADAADDVPSARRMSWFGFFRRDHAPELRDDAEGRDAAVEAVPAAPGTAPAAGGPRAGFDLDLGPDPVAVRPGESEPIDPINIGPGGTFGMDPLHTAAAPTPVGPAAGSFAPLPKPEVILPGVEAAVQDQAAARPEGPESFDWFRDPHAPAAPLDPEVIVPGTAGAGQEGNSAAAGPASIRPAASAQPAAATVDPFAGDGWISADAGAAPALQSDLDNLAAAALAKPQNAEQAAAALGAVSQPEAPENIYRYPPLELFEPAECTEDTGVEAELKANAQKLVETLESFGVRTRVLDISRGPSVTRYELQPLAGVKISRITSLADDIALNLAVAGVRIEAPIPGKPAVGIEVPNRKSTAVNIRGIFESQNYAHMSSPLTLALGKDIAGVAQVADLCKMPHLLIAGSTGSGKSVCVNSIIISFLYRSSPEDVKLILIDPKVVELAEYNGIPHLLMPVVTEPRKAAGALGSAVAEMEKRYRLFAENNVRDIKTFNKLAQQTPGMEKLPYIAIVIDELADLMMVSGKEVEDYICRIAQKARAAGMHLIVATQRPSVDVITGLIKANIPSRIAFAVSSQVDSRTILDSGGAEKLLGMGDMLFMPVGASKPTRIQGTYVRDEEITKVLDFIKRDSSASYSEEMIAEMEKCATQEKGASGSGDDAASDGDPMLRQCAEVVIDAGQASTSLLQRRCKLGYARAARIMDEMEQMGIIGPSEGAKPRAVLVSRQQWLEMNLSRGDAPLTPETPGDTL